MQNKKVRPCKYCRVDLNLWGPDRKILCPNCSMELRDVVIQCSGKCKQMFAIRYLERVTFFFSPGKKGGGKVSLYMCSSCLASMRSKASMEAETQAKKISIAENRLSRTRDQVKK